MTLPTRILDEMVELRSEKSNGRKDANRPYVGLEHIAQGSPRLLGWLPSEASVSTNSLFEEDDILFGKLRPNLRKSIRAPFAGYCSTDILVLRSREGIAPGFASHVFQWEDVFNIASATAAGTKMPRTSWNELRRFRTFCPATVDEQSRIAMVLDTIDAAIERTGAVIGKQKQIRAGLLHDLLTRGIDDNGELRDPDIHPEDFQDSAIGRFPYCWTPETIRGCLRDNPQNGVYKPARLIGKGVLLIGQTCIDDDRQIDIGLARRVEVAPVESSRYGLAEGDILVSRVFATLGGVGQPALVPALSESAVYESNMMRLWVNRDRVHPRLRFELLRHASVRSRIVAAAHLSNQASINQAGLNSIRLFLPPIPEQLEVVHRIELHEQTIHAVARDERKLKQLKSGLMSNLLTGHVPVPENITEEFTHGVD